jgi:CO/xanthine dehydrogenase Mo-binding subunit
MAFARAVVPGGAGAAIARRVFEPTLWFEIDREGFVTVNIAKAEMGQHVGTALARIVADELGADWPRVRIRHVDSDRRWGHMITGGSWSVHTSFLHLSRAGAAGRHVLRDAGAALLGVSPGECIVADGRVMAGERAIDFAAIVRDGEVECSFSEAELAELRIKSPAARRLIGYDADALDVPAKCDGSVRYGIDVARHELLHACPVLPPSRYGAHVISVDESSVRTLPGYRGHLRLDDPSGTLQGWVLVLADDPWTAFRAAQSIEVAWHGGDGLAVSESDLLAAADAAIDDEEAGALLVDEGDVDAAFAGAERSHRATYRTHTALHFALEPLNAMAEERDGTWHIHAGCQWPSLALPLLARALEVDENRIVLHQYPLGGGFGRRLVGDYLLPAALAAKTLGRAVKVIFPREDDSRFDCPRSPSVQRLEAALDDANVVHGVRHHAVAGWPTLRLAPELLIDDDHGNAIDPFSISGADHWYGFANQRVRTINNMLAERCFQPGWLRGVGPGWTAWGVECFIDELAALAGIDPIEFRLALLDGHGRNRGAAPSSVGGARRLAAVLRQLREQANWGRGLPSGQGQGVAVAHGQERAMPTWVGCVAEVAVTSATGGVRLDKLSLCIDCGTVIHPDGALAQAEGAALWGASMALHEGTAFAAGQVSDRNLDTYTPLRMTDLPELDIAFVDSSEFPVGLGEPPMLPVAPAIGNAIYQACGARVRELPIRRAAVQNALAARGR